MEMDLIKQIYDRYSREIYFYIFAMSGSRYVAEDIMQEVFVKAICSLQDSHTNIRAWLYKVAKNVYLNEMKKGNRSVPADSDELNNHSQDAEESVLSSIIRTEKEKVLIRGINELPLRQKKIIILQYFSELSVKEISAIMNLSTENVRVLAHRGKKKLKEFMEVNGYEI